MPDRVVFTTAALDLVRRLKDEHGPLMFHLSGGCCDGSAPMCFPAAEFRVGARDVLLGTIEGCPFYVGAAQFAYYADSQITVDVVSGSGDSFSLEVPEGVRFMTRSRLFTAEEMRRLAAAGPPGAPPQSRA